MLKLFIVILAAVVAAIPLSVAYYRILLTFERLLHAVGTRGFSIITKPLEPLGPPEPLTVPSRAFWSPVPSITVATGSLNQLAEDNEERVLASFEAGLAAPSNVFFFETTPAVASLKVSSAPPNKGIGIHVVGSRHYRDQMAAPCYAHPTISFGHKAFFPSLQLRGKQTVSVRMVYKSPDAARTRISPTIGIPEQDFAPEIPEPFNKMLQPQV